MTSIHVPRMQNVYRLMETQATVETARDYFRYDVPPGVDQIQVYRGYARSIADELEMSKHLVDGTITKLIALDSVRRVALGTNQTPSIFLLLKPPTAEDFNQLQERSLVTGRMSGVSPTQRLNDAVSRLTNKINELSQRLERVEVVLQNVQVRRPD